MPQSQQPKEIWSLLFSVEKTQKKPLPNHRHPNLSSEKREKEREPKPPPLSKSSLRTRIFC